jgi:hypothetical protein
VLSVSLLLEGMKCCESNVRATASGNTAMKNAVCFTDVKI